MKMKMQVRKKQVQMSKDGKCKFVNIWNSLQDYVVDVNSVAFLKKNGWINFGLIRM